MISIALILLVVAVIAGVLGFGLANAVTHIARFLFFVIVVLVLFFVLYMFFSYRAPPLSHDTVITSMQAEPPSGPFA